MLIQDDPPIHLTYCLNNLPQEGWEAHMATLRDVVPAWRAQIPFEGPVGLGLRWTAETARHLASDETARAELKTFLAEHNLYTFTVNAFPYGAFHQTRVKEKVYAPDWTTPEREAYTLDCLHVLADLLPEMTTGSLSTVPVSFKPWVTQDSQLKVAAERLARVALAAHAIYKSKGIYLHLGLEPEPACTLETTDELVAFFNDHLLPRGGSLVAETLGCSEDTAVQILRRHIGFCLDACHLALQFESLTDVLRTCKRENILISKVHVSAALKTEAVNADALQAFNESTYLHQVKGRCEDGSVTGWTDLPDLAAYPPAADVAELRCHFHVPLFWEGAAPLASTRDALDSEFLSAIQRGATQHLEIETYTFDVLPDAVRPKTVSDCMARETLWFLKQWSSIQS